MSLKIKLISAFLAITFLVIIVGIIGIRTDKIINNNFDRVQQETAPNLIALGQLKAAYFKMFLEAISSSFISAELQNVSIDNALKQMREEQEEEPEEDDEAFQEAADEENEEFQEAVAEINTWLAKYQTIIASYGTPEEQHIVKKLHQLIQNHQQIAQEFILMRQIDANSYEFLKKKEALEEAEQEFLQLIEYAIAIATAELEKGVNIAHQSANQAFFIDVIAIIISVLLVILFGVLATYTIVQPITLLKEAAIKIGQGQLYTMVSINSQDEIGVLAKTFNQMAKELNASYKQLANYNVTLEMKVEERTQALSQANEELQTTLEHLQTTQQELIQTEKMAALGQLIAGVAHEINTPLGAINSAVNTINKFLKHNLAQLPPFFHSLSEQQQQAFLLLLQRSLTKEITLTSKEERKFKRKLIRQLEDDNIKDADTVADTLVEMGIYDNIDPFLFLWHGSESDNILETAYQLSNIQRSAQTIDTAMQRASKIVFALKNFARYDASGEKVQADIIEGIETVLTLYHNQLKHQIEVIKHYDSLPLILCYPDELNQVWTNLIHNALQAMALKGTLTIAVNNQDNQVAISITDTGKGIPADIKDKIFEPFFTTKPAGEGSGLGLDIIRKIIEKHEGKMTFESQPGKTTFTVFLPTLISPPP
jgi:signal transduction histidine kinase